MQRADNATLTKDDLYTPLALAPNAIRISILFSISLLCSILAAFGALLAQQWLIHFKKTPGDGTERRRRHRELKLLGAWRWQLQPIVELCLPSLLQAAVFIFGIGLIDFLRSYNATVALPNLIIATLAMFLYVSGSVISFLDPYAPFQTSLPRLIVTIWSWQHLSQRPFTKKLLGSFSKPRGGEQSSAEVIDVDDEIFPWGRGLFQRSPEADVKLETGIAARLLENSEDSKPLRLTASNVLVLEPEPLFLLSRNPKAMRALQTQFIFNDDEETVALLARAITHLWMEGRPNFKWRWEGLNRWYGDPNVVGTAANAYTETIEAPKSFPSSAIPTVLLNMLQHPHDSSERSIEFLETAVFDLRDLGLVACYLQWIPGVLSSPGSARSLHPMDEEYPPNNLCRGMAQMYQEFVQ